MIMTWIDRAMARGICFKSDGLGSMFDTKQTPQMNNQASLAIQEYDDYVGKFQPAIQSVVHNETQSTKTAEAQAGGKANADVNQARGPLTRIDPTRLESNPSTAGAKALGSNVNAAITDVRGKGIENVAAMANKGTGDLNLANAGVKREAKSSLEQSLIESQGKQKLAETGAGIQRSMANDAASAIMSMYGMGGARKSSGGESPDASNPINESEEV